MQIPTQHLNILIVEDYLDDFLLIQKYLKEEHSKIEITKASNFSQAKKLLQSHKTFDVILLDLSLPDSADVQTLVTEIVSLSRRSPVIVITGRCSQDMGLNTLSLGISDYLLKDSLNALQLSKSIHYSIERKRFENRLSESEQKYKSIFDLSPLPMWVLDRKNLNFLDVNSAAIDMYGYSKEEFLTMNVRDLWTNKSEPEIEKVIINKKDDFFSVRPTHTTKKGEQIFVDVQSNPIIFDGIPARVSLIKNITAQLVAEKALLLSEQRFKALVQDGSDLVMILDLDGNVSYVSPSAKLVTGISAGKLQQNNFFDLIHKEDVSLVRNHILQLEKKKRVHIPSYRVRSSRKQWRWIETIVTNLTKDPAVEGIVANSRDITDFVIQEKKLKESLERYDIVAKATSDTITDYLVDADHMEYSDGFEIIFGYQKNEIEHDGHWWQERIHPEDRERVDHIVAEIHQSGQTQLQIEYRFKCADGNYKNILDRSYLVKDEFGNAKRMIGSMQDITELRNYIKTIEKHNDRLKDIAWTQSHVVRAPLARIMGLIDLLQNDKEVKDVPLLLNNVLSSAHELDHILREISSKTVEATETLLKC